MFLGSTEHEKKLGALEPFPEKDLARWLHVFPPAAHLQGMDNNEIDELYRQGLEALALELELERHMDLDAGLRDIMRRAQMNGSSLRLHPGAVADPSVAATDRAQQ